MKQVLLFPSYLCTKKEFMVKSEIKTLDFNLLAKLSKFNC